MYTCMHMNAHVCVCLDGLCMPVSTSSGPQLHEHCERNRPNLLPLFEVGMKQKILLRDVQI